MINVTPKETLSEQRAAQDRNAILKIVDNIETVIVGKGPAKSLSCVIAIKLIRRCASKRTYYLTYRACFYLSKVEVVFENSV